MVTALITGCDYGIGLEFARQYAIAGWQVHAVCLDETSRPKIEDLGGGIRFHHADVSDPTALSGLASNLSGQPIDLLINNAATFAPDGPGTLMLPEFNEFVRVMAVNARGLYVCCQEEMRTMIPAKRGFIINMSSVVGFKGYPDQSAYTASKHAVMGITKSLAVEAGEQGINVSVILPGGVGTDFTAKVRPDLDPAELIQPESEDFAIPHPARELISRSPCCPHLPGILPVWPGTR